MATLDSLQFEMERRVILFKPTTTMPDLSQLGYNADPNLIVSPSTPGEELLYYSPNNTRYVNYDASGNTETEWYKHSQPNGWLPLGGDSSINSFGTDSSTWQLNYAEGVVLRDASGNLRVTAKDNTLTTVYVGGLVIDNLTGILQAQDGSVYVDPTANLLKSFEGTLPGTGVTKNFIVNHALGTKRHIVSIYDASDNQVYPDIQRGINDDTISFNIPPDPSVDHEIIILGF